MEGGGRRRERRQVKMDKKRDRRRMARIDRGEQESNLHSPSSNFQSSPSTLQSPSSWVGCEPWRFDGVKWVPQNPRPRKQIRSYRDLDVYNLAYTLAMEIFHLTARFPKEERYALVDQMRRSSRSVCSNIVEGFAKRRHEAVFKNSLNDSLGESEETKLWLDFSLDCEYIAVDEHKRLIIGYEQVSPMLWTLMTTWQSFQ